MTGRTADSRWLVSIVHLLRVGAVVALMLAIPSPQREFVDTNDQPPAIDQLDLEALSVPPAQLRVGSQRGADGTWPIVDEDGEVVGRVARTLPQAQDVVGYRGPTEAAIVFHLDWTIASVSMLESADTPEHVEQVRQASAFFQQFRQWPWGGPAAATRIDGVSGATLTSMALAEGVLKRIGGQRPSLVFPKTLAVQELQDWFPEAASIQPDEERLASFVVFDAKGRPLGYVIRTGPLVDDVIGYQGPTELLVRLNDQDSSDGDGTISAIRIRKSYDNEPYVDYVRVEAGFWATFVGKTWSELARFDPERAGVEGVSGATMTSLAVADTLVAAADRWQQHQSVRQPKGIQAWMAVRWTTSDLATIILLLFAGLLSRTGLFRRRSIRRIWLASVVVVIGFWAGNLVSLALIAGWSAEGIAWRLAPGLAAIASVALLCPVVRKSNPYCNHLCPHGAIQQWIKPPHRSWRHRHLPRRWHQRLRWIPGITLVAAYVTVVVRPAADLSAWEPFHAYLLRFAGWSSIALAIGSILVSALLPMGYCRLGCPTGRLIDYVRLSAASGRLRWADAVAVGLLGFALWWQM